MSAAAKRMNAESTAATPLCPHFGVCGGCQLQDLAYAEQLRRKQARLSELLQQGGISAPNLPTLVSHAAEPYGYRNRIRLRLQRVAGTLRFGYNRAGTTEFLPIATCPIAAPVLLQVAEALLALAEDADAAHWLNAAAELELFANQDLTRVQATLFCAPRTRAPRTGQPGSFDRVFTALHAAAPQLAGLAAAAFDPRTGPTGRILAEAGAPGLLYRVGALDFWVSRGSFFQVNRFLLETLVALACMQEGAAAAAPRAGRLAWDLYAGVGLFSCVLARSFAQVTAVEANPIACADLAAALRRLGPAHTALEATALDFLRRAVLDRDRPELIVLDPPRAGAGLEACDLLLRLAPQQIVYVSCDPTTLARDLACLQASYRVAALHLVDLFPQTIHQETVAILDRSS